MKMTSLNVGLDCPRIWCLTFLVQVLNKMGVKTLAFPKHVFYLTCLI